MKVNPISNVANQAGEKGLSPSERIRSFREAPDAPVIIVKSKGYKVNAITLDLMCRLKCVSGM